MASPGVLYGPEVQEVFPEFKVIKLDKDKYEKYGFCADFSMSLSGVAYLLPYTSQEVIKRVQLYVSGILRDLIDGKIDMERILKENLLHYSSIFSADELESIDIERAKYGDAIGEFYKLKMMNKYSGKSEKGH
jgi:hypothetical protein